MAEDSLSDLERSDPELLEKQAEQDKTEEIVEPVPPPAEEVVETEPEVPVVEEPVEEPQMVSKDRFDELNDRLKTSDERNEELMRMMLESGQQKQGPPEPPPAEIDPDVAALVKPIVDASLKAERKQYEGVQDLIAERNQLRALEAARGLVPKDLDTSGINWSDVEKEWLQMPKQVQPQLDNVGGIAFLMQRIAAQAAPPVKDENLEALSRRSHTGGESKAPLQAPKVTPQDVYNMTEEEFAKFTKGQSRGGKVDDPNYVDPLLR